LAAQIRIGYYPAAPGAIDAMLRHLDAAPGATVLDPCCGKGAALGQLARGLRIPPGDVYGIELDAGRAGAAREAIPGANILGPASFAATRISYNGFSLAYVNPPFDDEIGGGGRIEATFLYRATALLKPGGVLALVLPERTFGHSEGIRGHLDAYYEDPEVYRFPEAHRPYRELCVLGVKRARPMPPRGYTGRWEHRWERWRVDAYTALPELGAGPRLTIPPGLTPRWWEQADYTEAQLVEAIERSPLNQLLEPPKPRPMPSPPLSLGEGHIGLLLVSGHINGLLEPPGGPAHVVRGSIRKEWVIAERTEDVDEKGCATIKERKVERQVPVVRLVDQSGEILTLEG
jgi:SAM-dependent methyltransferase